MSFNIRCGSCEQPTSINHWSQRRALVADQIRQQKPDLLGLQEAELFQVRDLAADLGNYGWYGVGREDGKEKGETTAIFYNRARFVVEEQRTYWLSETPATPSKGWDAALSRTATIVTLTDSLSSRRLVMLNAHFDHRGQQARLKSSELLVEQTKSARGLPVIVTGDFNYTKASEGYKVVAAALRDTEQASLSSPSGGDLSFNGFGKDLVPGNKIDFVFVSDQFVVDSHKIISERYADRYASDHYPVVVSLRYK